MKFKRNLIRWSDVRSIILILSSVVAFEAARIFALMLRFDFDLHALTGGNKHYFSGMVMSLVSYTVLAKVFFLGMFGQYSGIMKYYGIGDVKRLIYSLGAYSLFTYIFLQVPNGWKYINTPRSVLIIDVILSFLFWVGLRTGLRILREYVTNKTKFDELEKAEETKNVAIIGAGDVGAELVEEIENKGMGMEVVALFDDNSNKWRSRVHGIKVYGPPNLLTDNKLRNSLHLQEAIIAMPSASPKRLQELVTTLQQAKLPYRIVPSMAQLTLGQVDVTKLRKVEIEDLLQRDPIKLDTDNIKNIICGKTVFVTGAGGSIGSELCRQILRNEPMKLVLIEQCEVQMFLIQQELIAMQKELNLANKTDKDPNQIIVPGIADIVDQERMDILFDKYKPEVVFHAAAHKHVPLMEGQPSEAIKNNTFATARLAEMSMKHGVGKFVMISTDKAINPTNVMGATKRMAELFVQALSSHSTGTQFMAVRFGNVLGSSGSVIPTFKKQIEAGGPVTVTHRDITRFFMTIPEAVGLVLQCATQGNNGDIFVLDMGEPVKIADLARNLIRLSGLEPEKDIEIKYVGLRPGEKLYEELSYVGENVEKTEHPKIMRFISTPRAIETIREQFLSLKQKLNDENYDEIKKEINKIVPEYRPYLKEK